MKKMIMAGLVLACVSGCRTSVPFADGITINEVHVLQAGQSAGLFAGQSSIAVIAGVDVDLEKVNIPENYRGTAQIALDQFGGRAWLLIGGERKIEAAQ
jgi:hypothetical protein